MVAGSELHIEIVNPKNTTVVMAPNLEEKEKFVNTVNQTIDTLLRARPNLKGYPSTHSFALSHYCPSFSASIVSKVVESNICNVEQREKGLRIHYDEEAQNWTAEVVHQKYEYGALLTINYIFIFYIIYL
jgi:hypothetical protein